jgi:protein gp37
MFTEPLVKVTAVSLLDFPILRLAFPSNVWFESVVVAGEKSSAIDSMTTFPVVLNIVEFAPLIYLLPRIVIGLDEVVLEVAPRFVIAPAPV